MFNIQILERTMVRKRWIELYRVIRKVGDRVNIEDESVLAERVSIAKLIKGCTEDGKVAVVTSGRDCDCSEFCWCSIKENLSAMKFIADRDDAYNWADGPMHIGICKPSERPEVYSRDLAMEAHEDGHPHIVSSVRFDEYGSY